ncbi:LysM peptidoglycan-binding domain-containing protein [bacterium]|nr:LysM peptidoglycan-binding domain-containing protein [bacterium]
MQKSTLYRSNLTKEKMALLEELQNEAQTQENNLSVYKRPSREKELDVLWKNFKLNQKSDKSPGVYLTIGFITGAFCMFLMTALLSFGTNAADVKAEAPAPKVKKEFKLSFIPANKKQQKAESAANEAATATTYQSYTVVSGDTLEKIIIRFYGRNDVSKVDKIVEANKLSSPNSLSIGQKLVIPMD